MTDYERIVYAFSGTVSDSPPNYALIYEWCLRGMINNTRLLSINNQVPHSSQENFGVSKCREFLLGICLHHSLACHRQESGPKFRFFVMSLKSAVLYACAPRCFFHPNQIYLTMLMDFSPRGG